jgi:hypothetical protein
VINEKINADYEASWFSSSDTFAHLTSSLIHAATTLSRETEAEPYRQMLVSFMNALVASPQPSFVTQMNELLPTVFRTAADQQLAMVLHGLERYSDFETRVMLVTSALDMLKHRCELALESVPPATVTRFELEGVSNDWKETTPARANLAGVVFDERRAFDAIRRTH